MTVEKSCPGCQTGNGGEQSAKNCKTSFVSAHLNCCTLRIQRERQRRLRGRIYQEVSIKPRTEDYLLSLPGIRKSDAISELGRIAHPVTGHLAVKTINGQRIYSLKQRVPA